MSKYSPADQNFINLLANMTPEQAKEFRSQMLPVLYGLREQILAPKFNGTSKEKARQQVKERLWEISDKPLEGVKQELETLFPGTDEGRLRIVAMAAQLIVNTLLWDQDHEKDSFQEVEKAHPQDGYASD